MNCGQGKQYVNKLDNKGSRNLTEIVRHAAVGFFELAPSINNSMDRVNTTPLWTIFIVIREIKANLLILLL